MATETEREAITSHLLDYGDENDFRPLVARDYGSRARGLAGPDSDYDVFFIFAQPPAAYATGGDTDTYEKTIPAEESLLDEEIELHGWNLQKFIGNDGLTGSNPTAIEFTTADNQQYYWPDEDWGSDLLRMIDHARIQFKPYALINHFRSLAASNYGKYIEGDYKIASDASYADLDELLDYNNFPSMHITETAVENAVISEEETEIREDRIEVVLETETTALWNDIDIEEALDAGLIEETTTDRTIKRHLNIEQALIKARYIEEHHKCPTMDFTKLLRDVAGAEWLPEHIYAEIGGQICKKKAGDGEKLIEYDKDIHGWIESELSREIEPKGHVERQPDTSFITRKARSLYNQLDWSGNTGI